MLSDDSGYYFGSNRPLTSDSLLWRYLFSSPANVQCQNMPVNNVYLFGQLMLNDNQLFFLYREVTPAAAHFYKITFGSTAMDWANVMSCPGATCSIALSESLLSNDKKQYIAC